MRASLLALLLLLQGCSGWLFYPVQGLPATPQQAGLAYRDLWLNAADGTDETPGFAVFWVLTDPALAGGFDRVLIFEAGRIVEDRRPAEEAAEAGAEERVDSLERV